MAKADLEDLEKFEKESSGYTIAHKDEDGKITKIAEVTKEDISKESPELKWKNDGLGKKMTFTRGNNEKVVLRDDGHVTYYSGKKIMGRENFKDAEAFAKHQLDLGYKLVEDEELVEDAKQSKAEQEKVGVVMKEFKEGELKSGSGEKVTDPKQAIAIALSEAEKVKDEDIPEKQDEPEKAGDDKALIKGEEEMTEEVKEALAEEKVDEAKKEEVVDDACGKAEDKEVKACDKSVDKRALIDEIGGILKDKVDEELWRTVIAKAEELAYNDSEASADDEKKEELKEEEKAEEVKEEVKEEAKEEMAKDEAMVMDADAIRAEAREEVLADFKARETARKAVRKMVGDVDVFAFDSAEEIYKFACEKSGMDLTEVASYKDAFRGLTAAKSKLALDASPISGSNVECLKDIRIAY